jgi:hypothetical protein
MRKLFISVLTATAMCYAVSGAVTTPLESSPPKGLRIFTCAHSFHNFVPGLLSQVAKSAGIEDHAQLGASSIGGSTLIQHWDVADEKNVAKRLLQEGRVDALTLSPIWFPDAGLEKFGELALKHNPDIRIFVNEFWIPNDVYDPVYPLQTKVIVDHNAATIPDLKKQQDLYCQEVQKNLNELNSKLGKNVFFMVPVGHAVVALREKIIAGQAPGLSVQQDLFRDNWGHPQVSVKVLAAYCFYACIYHRSPVGLEPGKGWGLDEKLVRLLQELAWDAVINHPMTDLPVKE